MNRRRFIQQSSLAGVWLGFSTAGILAGENKTGSLIIDAHCHAGKGFNYAKSSPSLPPWTTWNDPKWTLRRMEEAQIERTIIFPISNVTYKAANEEIASYVRRWPDKFIGFAKHDAKTEASKIRDLLRREVQELGLKGLKLHGVPSQEMAETAAELQIPVLFHPPSVSESLDVVRSHPEVNFILAHLGSFASQKEEEHRGAIAAAKELPNLYLDTSAVVFVQYLEQAARELPAQKLIFGSDGPLVDAREELNKIRLLRLPTEKENLILGGNIRRLLRMRT